MKKIVVLLGAPGCGKGTQATMLAEAYGLTHISTGDVLRGIIKEDGDLGNKVREIINSGNLVPDDMMMEIFQKVILGFPEAKGFIFDGFPRTIPQAEMFDKFLYQNFPDSSLLFIELQVEEKERIERIARRAIVEGRFDDRNPEIIKNRIEQFTTETLPVIEQYRGYPSYYMFHGTGKKASEVYEEVKTLFN